MTGKLIDGTEAERIGLANRVAPAEELEDATQALVDELLACAPVAVGLAKRGDGRLRTPRAGGDARARGRDAGALRALGRLRGGRERVPREAPAAVHRELTGRARGRLRGVGAAVRAGGSARLRGARSSRAALRAVALPTTASPGARRRPRRRPPLPSLGRRGGARSTRRACSRDERGHARRALTTPVGALREACAARGDALPRPMTSASAREAMNEHAGTVRRVPGPQVRRGCASPRRSGSIRAAAGPRSASTSRATTTRPSRRPVYERPETPVRSTSPPPGRSPPSSPGASATASSAPRQGRRSSTATAREGEEGAGRRAGTPRGSSA